ncbi:MAG TPA: phosphodiesterase [Gammaproteobacteria bacterium]|nr:phosphodiesterase [Gammaproteobacteria bacterium]
MIIAQITDLHIGFAGKGKPCTNVERLTTVADTINKMLKKPDVIIATGDLVESGEIWAYHELKKAIGKFDYPMYFALGNHDCRENFCSVFTNTQIHDGFVQYTIEDYPVRIIVIDTLQEGMHGGSFCQNRQEWLSTELAKHPEKPTVIAMHHPPIETGIDWLTAHADDEWVKSLQRIIRANRQVIHIMAGHVHRSIYKTFAGTSISVSQAIAPQAKLELASINPQEPDGRAMFVEAQPGFSLHYWDGDSITTHSGQAPCGNVIFHFDDEHAPFIRHAMDIKP